jgi:hypothetical protein
MLLCAYQAPALVMTCNETGQKEYPQTKPVRPRVEVCFGYGSKNGYGSIRYDPDVWNEGVQQMISNDSISSKGYGSWVWITCASWVWIGTLHFELQPFLLNTLFGQPFLKLG